MDLHILSLQLAVAFLQVVHPLEHLTQAIIQAPHSASKLVITSLDLARDSFSGAFRTSSRPRSIDGASTFSVVGAPVFIMPRLVKL